ncbi:MAG TPA: hypothetical protein VG733_17905 [Chthoniobacteraceae bacterium]|nr:hypothetical protein [Chthoniobacteraceae bacterium]
MKLRRGIFTSPEGIAVSAVIAVLAIITIITWSGQDSTTPNSYDAGDLYSTHPASAEVIQSYLAVKSPVIFDGVIIYFMGIGLLYFVIYFFSLFGIWYSNQYHGTRFSGTRLGIFLLILLVVGDFFSFWWGVLIYGNLYYSADYCGFDFYPYWPFTQELIDAPFGNETGCMLHGFSLWQLECVWALFAAATWVITIRLYRFFCVKIPLRGATTAPAASA